MTRSFRTSLLLFAASLAAWLAAPLRAEQRTQDFSTDPGWPAAPGNHVTIGNPPTVRQNFGWQSTAHAAARSGEIGGEVWRSLTPAWYGTPVGPLTLNDAISCSGTLAALRVVQTGNWETGSTIFLGFFNPQADQRWAPRNFLGLRLESRLGEPSDIIIHSACITSRWTGWGGVLLKNPGALHQTALRNMKHEDTLSIAADGARHTWSVRYDPKGRKGHGQLEVYFDGQGPYRVDATEQDRNYGITATHFGIMNTQIPGNEMIVHFGDLTLNGRPVDLTRDPNWPGAGNHATFPEPNQYGTNNFGFTPTSHAGGRPGELGGRFWRVEEFERELHGNYGDDVSTLTLENRLEASGRIAATTFSNDAGVFLGWYNSQDQTWPLKNFVGAYMDSSGSVGRFFAAHCANARDQLTGDRPYPLLYPDGKSREWKMLYDPLANGGNGALTVTLDGQSHTLNLPPGFKSVGARLDRFGVFNMQDNNGKWADIYFDDLTYTAPDRPAKH